MWPLNSLANPSAVIETPQAAHRPSSGDPRVVYVGGRPRRGSTERLERPGPLQALPGRSTASGRLSSTGGVLQQSVQLTSAAEQTQLDDQPCYCDKNGVLLVSCCCLLVFALLAVHHLTGSKLFDCFDDTVADDGRQLLCWRDLIHSRGRR